MDHYGRALFTYMGAGSLPAGSGLRNRLVVHWHAGTTRTGSGGLNPRGRTWRWGRESASADQRVGKAATDIVRYRFASYPCDPVSRTSRKRRATIISSPGWSIQTPTTIVLTLAGMPAEAPVVCPVEGLSSMLGVPRRSSVMTSRGEIFNFSWL